MCQQRDEAGEMHYHASGVLLHQSVSLWQCECFPHLEVLEAIVAAAHRRLKQL